MVGTWWPDRGPGVLASWPEGKGDPFALFGGGGAEAQIHKNGLPFFTDKKNPTFEEGSSQREGIQLR